MQVCGVRFADDRQFVCLQEDEAADIEDAAGGSEAAEGIKEESVLSDIFKVPLEEDAPVTSKQWQAMHEKGERLRAIGPSKRFAEHFHTFRVGGTDPHRNLSSSDRISAPLY